MNLARYAEQVALNAQVGKEKLLQRKLKMKEQRRM